MEVAVGANGAMLLAVVIMQLLAALRWLAVWVFDSSKKKEEARDKLLVDLAGNIKHVSDQLSIIKHTMKTEEDIKKIVRLEHFEMNHKGPR